MARSLRSGAKQDGPSPLRERNPSRSRSGPQRLVDRIGHGNRDYILARAPAGKWRPWGGFDLHSQVELGFRTAHKETPPTRRGFSLERGAFAYAIKSLVRGIGLSNTLINQALFPDTSQSQRRNDS